MFNKDSSLLHLLLKFLTKKSVQYISYWLKILHNTTLLIPALKYKINTNAVY